MKYRTIVADPPWSQPMMGHRKRTPTPKIPHGDPGLAFELPYRPMSIDAIKSLPVAEHAVTGCHLWLWTTNAFLRDGFEVMEAWGFKYLAPITWVKPSGIGNYFVHVTQTVLFGYRDRCLFPSSRYRPTVLVTRAARPARHSEKPAESYELIESISPGPYLELFARRPRLGWSVWGNEVESDIEMPA